VPILVRNVAVDFRIDADGLLEHLLRRLSVSSDEVIAWRIVRKALDARKKTAIKYVYSFQVTLHDEKSCMQRLAGDPDVVAEGSAEPCIYPAIRTDHKIVIAGMGPAGLFAGIRLAEYGLQPAFVERGRPVEERVRDVESFWTNGRLDPDSNVQFGEGGAGTFSDGKLTTRIREDSLRYILEKLVRFGAPDELLTLAKPHIGTDRLRRVVREIRRHLLDRGMEIGFSRKLTDIIVRNGRVTGVVMNHGDEVACDHLVLATGHSARDTYEMLRRRSISLEPKPFAIGVRVEHPQELINRIQYGIPSHPRLPQAEYVQTYRDPESGRPVYTFCMCPGGVVLAAASEEGCLVTNGMSNFLRDSGLANSAVIVGVDRSDFPGSDPLAGVEFQRMWERKAFAAGQGNYFAPAQNLMDFVTGKGARGISSSYRPGTVEAALADMLPADVSRALKAGFRHFDRKMRGFLTEDATLTGVETRTSSPVRILRGDDCQSINLAGLYPAGEGAGYAGGIMSAAADGIRVADSIARKLMMDPRSSE